MDNIQKELIKKGHKDLADEYYKKISAMVRDKNVDAVLKALDKHHGILFKKMNAAQKSNSKAVFNHYKKTISEIAKAKSAIEGVNKEMQSWYK